MRSEECRNCNLSLTTCRVNLPTNLAETNRREHYQHRINYPPPRPPSLRLSAPLSPSLLPPLSLYFSLPLSPSLPLSIYSFLPPRVFLFPEFAGTETMIREAWPGEHDFYYPVIYEGAATDCTVRDRGLTLSAPELALNRQPNARDEADATSRRATHNHSYG